MKTHWIAAGALFFAVIAGFAPAQDPTPKENSERKIVVLEKDLVSTRQRVEALSSELGDTRAALEQTMKYLSEQAASSRELAKALDASEQAGFTFGINPESRQILLRAWRERIDAAQRNLPAVHADKSADGTTPTINPAR
jgi:hypothetical protein